MLLFTSEDTLHAGDDDDFVDVLSSLSEIFITYPTLLMMTNRHQEAITLLDKADYITNYLKEEFIDKQMSLQSPALETCSNLLGKIRLIKISLEIKNRRFM